MACYSSLTVTLIPGIKFRTITNLTEIKTIWEELRLFKQFEITNVLAYLRKMVKSYNLFSCNYYVHLRFYFLLPLKPSVVMRF